MRARIGFWLLTLPLVGCAGHTSAAVHPTLQTHLGPAQDFGPGIVDVTPSDVDLRLDVPAYVIALRVSTELGIQVIAPVTGSPASKRGAHYFRGGAPPALRPDTALRAASSKPCVYRADSRESCAGLAMPYRITQLKQGGAPADAAGYWLLIVSDVPTPARDVMRRLAQMDLAFISLEALVQRIPEPLIGSRTTHWAAYYAPFGTP